MKRGDGQVYFRTYLNLPSLEELSILPLRSHRGRSLAGTRKALWLLGVMPDVVDVQGLSSPSIVRFRIDEVGSICQWSALMRWAAPQPSHVPTSTKGLSHRVAAWLCRC